jgi:TRAP-type mannitol/chloroaromatic compound transport system permease small subunit
MQQIKKSLEWFAELIGSAVAWLTIFMVVGTFVIVVLRYAFDLGWIAMQESIIWMHAMVFMLGAAYTLKRDEHVRVDIFYRGLSTHRRAVVDLVGTILFLLPITAFLVISSWDYVSISWMIRESSREAGGLPYPFVPILKSIIPLTAVLLGLQGIANLISSVSVLNEKRTAPLDHSTSRGGSV